MVSSSYMYIRYVSVYMIYVYIVCMCILKFTSWRGYSWYFSYGHLISVSENGEFNYEKMMVWFVFEKLTLYIIIHHHPIGGEHLPSRNSNVRDMWYSPSILEAWNASPTLALWNRVEPCRAVAAFEPLWRSGVGPWDATLESALYQILRERTCILYSNLKNPDVATAGCKLLQKCRVHHWLMFVWSKTSGVPSDFGRTDWWRIWISLAPIHCPIQPTILAKFCEFTLHQTKLKPF